MPKLTFNELSKLTDREVQILLRETDQKDLVVALKGAKEDLKERVLGNMSERVRTFIAEEMEFLGPMRKEEITEVQGRIVDQVRQLAEQGHVVLPPGSKAKAKKGKPRPNKRLEERKRKLKAQIDRRLDEMSHKEIEQTFRSLAEVARREGILALGSFAEKMGDPFMQSAFRLAVDGTEPDLIVDILETWLESLAHEYKRKHQKVIEGIMSIQAADHPRVVEHKLSLIF